MNSLNLTGGIVIPMFLLMLCGWLLRNLKVLPASVFPQMNKLCFTLLLPASLINNLLKMENLDGLRLPFLGWLLLLQVLIVTVLYLLVPHFVREKRSAASIIQACFRSNFLTFGLVIAQALCAPEKLGIVSVSAGLLIPLYNIGGILILQHGTGGKTTFRRMTLVFCRNPFVIACALGLLIIVLHIAVPSVIKSAVGSLGGAATTVSFIALGGCIDLAQLKKIGKQVMFGTFMRLICLPLLIIGVTWLIGFRDIELLTVIVMAISPTAVATFPMAERMGADGPLAGYLVAAQSVCSIGTMFLWLLALSGMGWI